MSTIILIPKNKDVDTDKDHKNLQRAMEGAKQAAVAKTHFVMIIDPEEYEVFASPGTLEEVESQEGGEIRINLSMFDGG